MSQTKEQKEELEKRLSGLSPPVITTGFSLQRKEIDEYLVKLQKFYQDSEKTDVMVGFRGRSL